jgi:hypothetical protein
MEPGAVTILKSVASIAAHLETLECQQVAATDFSEIDTSVIKYKSNDSSTPTDHFTLESLLRHGVISELRLDICQAEAQPILEVCSTLGVGERNDICL